MIGPASSAVRARATAAALMMAGSAILGFMAGRLSVWLAPVEKRAPTSEAAATAALPASKPEGDATKPTKPVALAPSGKTSDLEAAAEPAQVKVVSPSSNIDAKVWAPPPTAPPSVTMVNPQASVARAPGSEVPPAAEPASAQADDATDAECERRYSSYRRSDGTYQPFGGGPRRPCALRR